MNDASGTNPEQFVGADGAASPQSTPSTCIRKSVYDTAVAEAHRYKWIESEKAQCDLGEWAIRAWVHDHWGPFIRERWVEHLEGRVFWIELDRGDFGLLTRPQADPELMEQIVSRIKTGGENLDILCWAHDQHLPCETIGEMIEILETLNINEHRIECPLAMPVARAG